MPHWERATPLWLPGIIAFVGFLILVALLAWRKGVRAGLRQAAGWAVAGVGAFIGMLFKYPTRTALWLIAFAYPAMLLATGLQPHRLADVDAAFWSDVPNARATRRYFWKFLTALLIEGVAIWFLVGEPGVRN